MAGSTKSTDNPGEDGFCSECYGLGQFRIEKRDVKGFREIYVRCFECEDCGRKAEEAQLAGQYGPQGVTLRLAVPQGDQATLGRRLLKSDTASVAIPELEFEIGAASFAPFAGDITTVADVLMQACKNLNMNQAERQADDAETASKIDDFILELEGYAAGEHAFTFEIHDVAGNSYIEGPDCSAANGGGPGGDPQLTVERFDRTAAQDSRMGLALPEDFLAEHGEELGGAGELPASAPGRLILRVEGQQEAAAFLASYAAQDLAAAAGEGSPEEALQEMAATPPTPGIAVPRSCPACGTAAGAGFIATLHQPAAAVSGAAEGATEVGNGGSAGGSGAFIRDCLIVSTSCSACSAAAVEVRSSGGVAPRGARIRVRVEDAADLARPVLQSSSASLALPELELALSTGSAGGLATTVGQLISSLADQLGSNPAAAGVPGAAPGALGDEDAADWASFVGSLKAFARLERPWVLELTDPLDCSLIGPRGGGSGAAGAGKDAQLSVQHYERTPDENDHFGLAAGGGAAPIA